MNSLKADDDSPYPHKFLVTISLTEFIEKYTHVNDGEQHPDVVSVAGELHSPFYFYLTLFFIQRLF